MEFQNLEPPERVRRMLYNLIIECITFTDEEVNFVKDCLLDMEVRLQLSEFLQAFTSPRQLENEDCLSMLGSIIRCVLDILWNDRES